MPRIIPIKDLKDTVKVSEMAHKSLEPIFVTKNGYGDMVFMSIETFERTIARNRIYDDLEISERQGKEGRVKNTETALSEMREKYGI